MDAITLELYGYKSAVKYQIHFLQSHGNHINKCFSAGKPYNLPVSIATGMYLHINVSIGIFDVGKMVVYIVHYSSLCFHGKHMQRVQANFVQITNSARDALLVQ